MKKMGVPPFQAGSDPSKTELFHDKSIVVSYPGGQSVAFPGHVDQGDCSRGCPGVGIVVIEANLHSVRYDGVGLLCRLSEGTFR